MNRRLRTIPLLATTVIGAVPSAAAGAVSLRSVGAFREPVHVAAPPGDTHRVYVVERRGVIRVIEDGRVRRGPFLDLSRRVSQPPGIADERGLHSVAFAPDYATSGRFYVYYTRSRDGRDDANTVVLDEYRSSGAGAAVAAPGTRREVLAIQTGSMHFGGQVAFGPDGYLWLAPGDGRGPGDPDRHGQNRRTLLGKMLRIDPRPGRSLAPAGNPYRRPAGARLVWASGLRNPYRFSFDRVTGALVIGDVGQNFVEEIDVATRAQRFGRGANFGWSRLEGRFLYRQATPRALRPAMPRQEPRGYIGPAIEHLHRRGWCAITGGHVVRDPRLPELYGRYVYGDFCRGAINSARITPGGRAVDVRSTGLRVDLLSSFGEDGCGRVYVASLRGRVYRLSGGGGCAGPAPSPFPVPDSTPASSPGVFAGWPAPLGGVLGRFLSGFFGGGAR